jgi:hypothetical protein
MITHELLSSSDEKNTECWHQNLTKQVNRPCKHVHIRNNIKMHLAKINCEDVNCTDVPQQWGFVVGVMNYNNSNVGSSEHPELHI